MVDRTTSSNQFVDSNPDIDEIMECAMRQLAFMSYTGAYAKRELDLASVVITTKRIPNGKICVRVEANVE